MKRRACATAGKRRVPYLSPEREEAILIARWTGEEIVGR